MDELMKSLKVAESVATIIFIVGAGGAFKEIILKANVGDYIAEYANKIFHHYHGVVNYSLIRIATGQGVVSATAAGIVGPLIPSNVNPVLMVLATAAGSNTIT